MHKLGLSGARLVSLLILCAAFAFMMWQATRGIDLTDEGLYVATPLRFALGDSPYTDEDMSVVSQYNVLTSYVFRVCPDISLFEFRVLGLAIYMLAVMSLFLIFSAYASPVFVSVCAATAFFIANFYRVFPPSYDLLSSSFSIFALSSWIHSQRGNFARRAAFASLAGLFYSIAVLIYPTLGLLVLVPAGTAVYKRDRASFQALGFFVAGSALIALLFAAYLLTRADSGLFDAFASRLSSIAAGRLSASYGNILMLLRAYASLTPLAAAMTGTLYFCVRFLQSRRWGGRFFSDAAALVALFCVFFVWSGAFGRNALAENIQLDFIIKLFRNPRHIKNFLTETRIVAFVFSVSAIFLFLALKGKDGRHGPSVPFERAMYTSIAWGIIAAVSYGISSNRPIRAPHHALSLILIPVFAGIYYLLSVDSKPNAAGRRGISAIYTAMFAFLISGVVFNFTEVRHDSAFGNLDREFSTPKLRGIYSTEKKVASIDGLMAYLEGRVRKGDLLLAYNNLPMIYYLTHTRPKYAVAWAMDPHAGSSLQEGWVRRLADDGNPPEYCIRMLANRKYKDEGDFNWSLGDVFSSNDRLDAFVGDNYYLEKLIYPFEVLRKGPGPKYRVFDAMKPAFADELPRIAKNDGPGSGGGKTPPMRIIREKGVFSIGPAVADGKEAMRIQPPSSASGKTALEIGYQSGEIIPGFSSFQSREVIFMVEAKLSGEIIGPASAPQLFIDDNMGKPWRNGVAIYAGSWRKYAVSMKPREGASRLTFGIGWQLEGGDQTLDIRDIRVIVL